MLNRLTGSGPRSETVNMTQLVPDKTQMRRYLSAGLTQKQIRDAWENDSGIKVSRSAIAMAIERYGLQSAHPRRRYEETLPWKVRVEHKNNNNARMLRLEGRRREGLALGDQEKRLLTQWRHKLEEAGAVIVYDPDTEQGFWWVARRDDDDDIVRVEQDPKPGVGDSTGRWIS